jgi:hypothetical protein
VDGEPAAEPAAAAVRREDVIAAGKAVEDAVTAACSAISSVCWRHTFCRDRVAQRRFCLCPERQFKVSHVHLTDTIMPLLKACFICWQYHHGRAVVVCDDPDPWSWFDFVGSGGEGADKVSAVVRKGERFAHHCSTDGVSLHVHVFTAAWQAAHTSGGNAKAGAPQKQKGGMSKKQARQFKEETCAWHWQRAMAALSWVVAQCGLGGCLVPDSSSSGGEGSGGATECSTPGDALKHLPRFDARKPAGFTPVAGATTEEQQQVQLLQEGLSLVVFCRFIGVDPGIIAYFFGVDWGHGVSGCGKAAHTNGEGRDEACPDCPVGATAQSPRGSPSSACAADGRRGVVKDGGAFHREACGTAAHSRQQQQRRNAPGPDGAPSVSSVFNTVTAYSVMFNDSGADARDRYRSRCAVWADPHARSVFTSMWERRWRLRKFALTQQHFHRLVQLLLWGFFTVKGVYSKHADPPLLEKPAVAIIGLGDASAGHGGCISRKGHAPTKKLQAFIVDHYYGAELGSGQTHVCLLMIDEWRTSQVCSRCGNRSLTKFGGVNKLLACGSDSCCAKPNSPDKKPPLVMDRDLNAGRNILMVMMAQLFPTAFCDALMLSTFRQARRGREHKHAAGGHLAAAFAP